MIESELTAGQISKKHEISGKTMQNWKKQFLENASLGFEAAKVGKRI
jgi:putative transposase